MGHRGLLLYLERNEIDPSQSAYSLVREYIRAVLLCTMRTSKFLNLALWKRAATIAISDL